MQIVKLITTINAPLAECFDLSRNIDLHIQSMMKSNEKAVAGKISGLIDLGEFVTWEAKHFYLKFKLTSKITQMEIPIRFVDEMINGPFKKMKHEHIFYQKGVVVEMIDIFQFESPLGILGIIFDKLFLRNYMRNLLIGRNKIIKQMAEAIKSPDSESGLL